MVAALGRHYRPRLMATWQEFAAAARASTRSSDAGTPPSATCACSPRCAATASRGPPDGARFFEGMLWIGGMPSTAKFRDLVRDPGSACIPPPSTRKSATATPRCGAPSRTCTTSSCTSGSPTTCSPGPGRPARAAVRAPVRHASGRCGGGRGRRRPHGRDDVARGRTRALRAQALCGRVFTRDEPVAVGQARGSAAGHPSARASTKLRLRLEGHGAGATRIGRGRSSPRLAASCREPDSAATTRSIRPKLTPRRRPRSFLRLRVGVAGRGCARRGTRAMSAVSRSTWRRATSTAVRVAGDSSAAARRSRPAADMAPTPR